MLVMCDYKFDFEHDDSSLHCSRMCHKIPDYTGGVVCLRRRLNDS